MRGVNVPMHIDPVSFAELCDVRSLALQNGLALSPCGRRVAYPVERVGDQRSRPGFPLTGVPRTALGVRLFVSDLEDGESIAVTEPGFTSWGPSWNSDGSRLAFCVAERDDGPVWLHVWEAATRQHRRIAPVEVQPRGFAYDQPRWTADDQSVCVTLVPDAGGEQVQEAPGVALGAKPSVVVFESPPAGDQTGRSQADGDIAVIRVETGEVRRLTCGAPAFLGFPSPTGSEVVWEETPAAPDPARFRCLRRLHCIDANGRDSLLASWEDNEWDIHPVRWSPDGSRFAVVADGQVMVWSVGATTAAPARPTIPDGATVGNGFVLWSADGRWILVYSAGALWKLPVTDAVEHARSWTVPGWSITGVLHQRARGWLPPNDLIVFAADQATRHQGLYRIHVEDTGASLLEAAPREYASAGFAAMGTGAADATPNGHRFVCAVRDGARPGETLWVASITGNERRKAVDLNSHLAGKTFAMRQRFRFRTNDGEELGARILLPPGWTPGWPCPTVVSIYPGAWPSEDPYSFDDGGVISHQFLAARGFAVLQPDIPYDEQDAHDPARACDSAVLPALNEAVRIGYVDNDRVAVEGCSLGGYGVVTLLCNTGRFRAAIAVAPSTDLISTYGAMPDALSPGGYRVSVRSTFGVAHCEEGAGGMGAPVWERPLRYVVNSPVFWLDRITTPLLLVAGSGDVIVPWSQAAEVFVGLRRLGRLCTLLVYKGEEHGDWSLPNRRDLNERTLGWLTRHLEGSGTP